MDRETVREFGEALRAARESSGIDLGAIAERTKISRRVLEALERGAFDQLPDEVFARLFLRQYLAAIKQDPQPWLTRFAKAWERYKLGSQRFAQVHAESPRPSHRGPWIVGVAVVVIGVLAMVLVEDSQHGGPPVALTPTPEMIAPTPASESTPQPTPTPTPPTALVLRTTTRACWIEVRVGDEPATARLLPPRSAWEIEAGERPVELVIGDAGALEITYRGVVQPPAGGDGNVARVRLAPSSPASRP